MNLRHLIGKLNSLENKIIKNLAEINTKKSYWQAKQFAKKQSIQNLSELKPRHLIFLKRFFPAVVLQACLKTQSKYPVLHLGTFGGTGFYFWAVQAARPIQKKKGSGSIISNFYWWFFHVFMGKIFLNKHCRR